MVNKANRFLVLILIYLFIFTNGSNAQGFKYHQQNNKKFEIPFSYTNGLIELEIKINGIPLKFIFDTGAEHTILSNTDILPLLNLTVTKEIEVYGADFSKSIRAFITTPVVLEVLGKSFSRNRKFISESIDNKNPKFPKQKPRKRGFIVKNTPILILDNDIFDFQNNKSDIQGILGASFFSNGILKIDYKKELLTLYPYNHKISLKGYQEVGVNFHGHKPIIETQIRINNQDTSINANILMDTGSSIPLLFLENIDTKFKLPNKTVIGQIGTGIGGDLMGYIGLVDKIEMGNFSFKGQISKFQNLDSTAQKTINKTRDGIIGNDVLRKFTIIIDNFKKKLYFKPNKEYYKPIKYDKSGISIYSTGENHNKFYIKNIIKGSPADLVGLKVKDRIYSAQYFNYIFWSNERVVNLFKKKENKKIRLKIIRDGKKYVFKFRLKDMFK